DVGIGNHAEVEAGDAGEQAAVGHVAAGDATQSKVDGVVSRHGADRAGQVPGAAEAAADGCRGQSGRGQVQGVAIDQVAHEIPNDAGSGVGCGADGTETLGGGAAGKRLER